MYTHRHIFWLYRHEDILFVFVLRYAHSNPFLILVNLYEVSPIHFVTMMDHHWGGSWGGGWAYIYIHRIPPKNPTQPPSSPPMKCQPPPTKEMVIRAVPANMAQAPIKAYVPALASILKGFIKGDLDMGLPRTWDPHTPRGSMGRVRYIYLHEWLIFYGKCKVNIPVPWILWVMVSFPYHSHIFRDSKMGAGLGNSIGTGKGSHVLGGPWKSPLISSTTSQMEVFYLTPRMQSTTTRSLSLAILKLT